MSSYEESGYNILEGPAISDKSNTEAVVKKVKKWTAYDSNKFGTASDTFDKISSGYYTIHYSNQIGLFFLKEDVNLNKLYRLPNKATDIILNDIDKFWKSKEVYEKYHRVYRRNYLIYSAPGTGKTSLINIMCKDLIDKYDGIVISINTQDDLENLVEAVRIVRTIEGDRKIIVVIEDIDNFSGKPGYTNSVGTLLLNILDGNYKMSNLVIIATTNYIDALEERYKNRPSRFDRVIEFPLPDEESRRIFIEKSVLPEDLGKIDILRWVERTKGFTIDHINELILLFFVYGHTEEEAFETIEAMVKNNNTLKNDSSINKRTIGFN